MISIAKNVLYLAPDQPTRNQTQRPANNKMFSSRSASACGREMEDYVEIIRSNKGGLKLIHKGYMYTVHKKRQSGGIRWRCTQRGLHCKVPFIGPASKVELLFFLNFTGKHFHRIWPPESQHGPQPHSRPAFCGHCSLPTSGRVHRRYVVFGNGI